MQEMESATLNNLTHPSSDVAAILVESGDQHILVTLDFSEKADDAIRHSGTSTSGILPSSKDTFDVFSFELPLMVNLFNLTTTCQLHFL